MSVVPTPKHTPGPWGCDWTSHHAHDYRLAKPDGYPLPVNAPANDRSEQRANARLIAAAPELLAALDAAMSAMIQAVNDPEAAPRWLVPVIKMCRPVIAKATQGA